MVGFRVNLALVGGFVLLALVSLVIVLAVLAGRARQTDRYYTEYVNVSGLKFGSQVLFEGYPVGQVEGIEPLQDSSSTRFRVELSVLSGWRIPADSVARSTAPGVLSPQIVAITAGQSMEALQPGAQIMPAEGTNLLSSLGMAASSFDQLTDQGLLPLLDNINQQVSLIGSILQSEVQPLVRNTDVILSATAESWPAVMAQIDTVSANLALTSERVNTFVSDDRLRSVDQLIASFDQTAQSLKATSEELNRLVAASGQDLQTGVSEFRYSAETLARYAEPIGQSLDASARNFQEFSQRLKQNPAILINPPRAPLEPVPPLRSVSGAE